MHPDIIKFWKDADQQIGEYTFTKYQCWFINYDYYKQSGSAPPRKEDIICQCWFTQEKFWNKKYYINNQTYAEEEMLKIIKLKAFL